MGTLQDMVVKAWNVSMDDGDAPSLFDIMYEVARRLDALAQPTDAARDYIAEFCSEFDLMREHLTDEQLANVLARYGYVPKWALSDCEAERDGAIKRAEYAEAERDSLKAQNKKLSEAFDRMCAHVADLEDEVEGRTEGVEGLDMANPASELVFDSEAGALSCDMAPKSKLDAGEKRIKELEAAPRWAGRYGG